MLLSVPVIDISAFPNRRQSRERRRRCRGRSGVPRHRLFWLISGHGVPTDLVEETRAVARGFFDLPLADKMAVRQPAPNVTRGYTPLESEAVARFARRHRRVLAT